MRSNPSQTTRPMPHILLAEDGPTAMDLAGGLLDAPDLTFDVVTDGRSLLDQVNARPQGLADIGESQHIVAGLQQRGHSAAAIAAIMGGNFIRVFGEAVG